MQTTRFYAYGKLRSKGRILAERSELVKARCLMACMIGVLALLSSAGGETTPPGSSQPADASPHRRPVIAEDLAVARQNRPAVPPPAAGPNFHLLTLTDVNNVDRTYAL